MVAHIDNGGLRVDVLVVENRLLGFNLLLGMDVIEWLDSVYIF